MAIVKQVIISPIKMATAVDVDLSKDDLFRAGDLIEITSTAGIVLANIIGVAFLDPTRPTTATLLLDLQTKALTVETGSTIRKIY
jgi:hypothetical protein